MKWGRHPVSQLAKNSASGAVTALVMIAILAITYPAFLSTLGYRIYGLWLLMSAVLNIAQLTSFGLAPALARVVAQDVARSVPGRIAEHWTTAVSLVLVSGTITFMAVLCVRPQLVQVLRIDADLVHVATSLLPAVAGLAALMLLVETGGAILAGVGRTDLTSYTQLLGQAGAALLALPLIYAGFGIFAFPVALICAYCSTALVVLMLLSRVVGLRSLGRYRCTISSLRSLIRLGFAVSAGSLAQLVLMTTVRVALSRSAGLSALPVYDLAWNGAMRLRGLVESTARALMPQVSFWHARDDPQSLASFDRVYRRATVSVLLFGLPGYLVLGFLAEPFLRFWLATAWSNQFPAAVYSALTATFLSAVGVPAYYTLLGLGLGRPLVIEKVLHAGVQLALICALIALHGGLTVLDVLLTAAMGTGASTVYLLWRTRRTCRVLLSRAATQLAFTTV